MRSLDVVIAGGGLAGAAFALELARNGRGVCILERTPGPKLKVCGDFLSSRAQELLAYLGLDALGLGAAPITTLRLHSARRSTTAALPFTAAGLSRLRLDQALLDAAERAGATVIRGSNVTGLVPNGSTVLVRAGSTAYQAPMAALATGKRNLRGLQRDFGPMTALKMPFALDATAQRALRGVVDLEIYEGGYIGACLVEDGTATLCWLADRRLTERFGSDWSAQLAHVTRGSRHFGALLQHAVPRAAKPVAVSGIPFGYVRRTTIADNVFPIGDQLAVIPSFTGDGICLALSSGIAAARAVIENRPAGEFQTAFLAALKPQFRWAAIIDAGFKVNMVRQLGVLAVAACPWLATALVQLTRFRGRSALEPV